MAAILATGPGEPMGQDAVIGTYPAPIVPRREYTFHSRADLDDIVISRDGSLAAYTSDETGTDEVYIRSFPEPGAATMVSQGGGASPSWSLDGNTVYYWTDGEGSPALDMLMAARLGRDPTPVVLSRAPVFVVQYALSMGSDLHPDGDRVLVPLGVAATTNQGGAGGPEERFVVVVNWFEELRQRLGN